VKGDSKTGEDKKHGPKISRGGGWERPAGKLSRQLKQGGIKDELGDRVVLRKSDMRGYKKNKTAFVTQIQ